MPDTDNGKSVWFKNFAAQLPAYATALKISANELQSVKDDCNVFLYALDCVEMGKTYSAQLIAFKDALRSGASNNGAIAMPPPLVFPPAPTMVDGDIFGRIRRLVQNIKTQKAYTNDIGKALGIIGETTTVNYADLKPEIKSEVTGGKVVVKWKKGAADSINVYVKRDDTGYVLAGNDAKPPFDDPTPLPTEATTWTYKAMYVVNDKEIGKASDEVSVLVQKAV